MAVLEIWMLGLVQLMIATGASLLSHKIAPTPTESVGRILFLRRDFLFVAPQTGGAQSGACLVRHSLNPRAGSESDC